MTTGRIVVGVDGSPESKAALQWAAAEGCLRQAVVEAVHAWEFPALAVTSYGGAALPVIAPEDIENAAQQLLRDTVASVGEPGCDVKTALVRGHAANALLAAAEGADLLVVGSRGRGGFTGLLLGSVSNHVVHHATCPVVVVRAGHKT
jgi:nucleotide-binding universal stress UspA family protein